MGDFLGGGDSSSSNAATSTNQTTVNVTVDNSDVAKALTASVQMLSDSNVAVAGKNAEAISTVSAAMTATMNKALAQVGANTQAVLDAYNQHATQSDKATIIAALVGAAALVWSKGG